MSIIKDFDELNIGFKTTVLTIICQMPFFYVAVYLFKHNLIYNVSSSPFADLNFYFLIAICFCFSITWFLVNIALSFLAINFMDKLTKTDSDAKDTYVATMIYSIVYLCAAIIVSYIFSFSFYTFLIAAYSYIIVRILLILIFTILLRNILK
jgi:hypothetical protein